MSNVPPFARVALPVPLGQAFSYRIPDQLDVTPGQRVFVQFGRRKVLGVVIDLQHELPADLDAKKIRPILAIADEQPALPQELLSFVLELARYYVAPLGEVLRLAVPALERSAAASIAEQAGEEATELQAVGHLVQVACAVQPLGPPVPSDDAPESTPSLDTGNDVRLPRGHARTILEQLRENGPREVAALAKEFSTARSALKKLEQRGLVRITREARATDPFFSDPVARDCPPELNSAQRQAVEALTHGLAEASARAFLLDGVTASGKTEVYLHAAEHALQRGQGVILLVPEIALTPQLVGRFRARLGDAIAVLHSGLKDKQRLAMWRSLREGKLRVAIGARSALFAPVDNLGLICVDEEHDGSFKQEEGVRYNARDMALLRAHRARAVCVLGSATPSLASEAAVMANKLTRLVLPARARAASQLPDVELVDLRRYGAGPSGDPLLSVPMHRAIEGNLQAGGQTILFLNRRGFAPSLICERCGSVAECPHCSVALTLHKKRGARLECHYCDFHATPPSTCSECESPRLIEEGLGTERVESLLAESFPTARIARLDRDVASGAKSEEILARVRRGEVDILVGTQMVTKGHDLPGVTLVGVLNADAALSLPDFRAAERTFHLLVQVAGRAGRAQTRGRVLIQTRNPEHPAVQAAQKHDVRAFIRHEMAVRKDVGYPPFQHLALIRFDGLNEAEALAEARRVARECELACPEVELLGPAAAPLARLRNRFRFRFMLRASRRGQLRQAVLVAARSPVSRKVRMSIDVDPLSML